MNDTGNSNHHLYLSLFISLFICMCLLETQQKGMIFPSAKAEDVISPSFQLIPYHSLLSAMFQPVSRQGRQFSSEEQFNSLYSSRRYNRRPPSRHQQRGYRKFYNRRKKPTHKRYSLPYRKFQKYYGRHPSGYRKPQNSFVPGDTNNQDNSEIYVDEPGPLSFRLGPFVFKQHKYPNPIAIPVYN